MDKGLAAGPLRGVPLVLKDLSLWTEGDPYHGGARFLKEVGWRAPHDSFLAQRFRAAGLVFLGKTNTPEFGSVPTTEPLAYGPTHNPWKLGYSSGGSSGGSAALVAAGVVPVGHGGDGGGSIRIPASCCGLFGLKPSRGRVSCGPDHGEGWAGFATEGVMSRSVRDSALSLDVMSGAHPGDPYAAPPPDRPFAAEPSTDPGRLRVGFLRGIDGVAVDPECIAAVDAALALLADLGHEVDDVHPAAMGEYDEFIRVFGTILACSSAAEIAAWERIIGRPLVEGDLEPGNLYSARRGNEISGAIYLERLEWMHAYNRRMARFWEAGYDVLVTPTLPIPPPPHGWFGEGREGRQRIRDHVAFTAPFNVTGQPAMSVPLHWSAAGLPVGVQIVGPANGEALLLRLAAQLEKASPWSERRPEVWAG